jgi:hypothetical protein
VEVIGILCNPKLVASSYSRGRGGRGGRRDDRETKVLVGFVVLQKKRCKGSCYCSFSLYTCITKHYSSLSSSLSSSLFLFLLSNTQLLLLGSWGGEGGALLEVVVVVVIVVV